MGWRADSRAASKWRAHLRERVDARGLGKRGAVLVAGVVLGVLKRVDVDDVVIDVERVEEAEHGPAEPATKRNTRGPTSCKKVRQDPVRGLG